MKPSSSKKTKPTKKSAKRAKPAITLNVIPEETPTIKEPEVIITDNFSPRDDDVEMAEQHLNSNQADDNLKSCSPTPSSLPVLILQEDLGAENAEAAIQPSPRDNKEENIESENSGMDHDLETHDEESCHLHDNEANPKDDDFERENCISPAQMEYIPKARNPLEELAAEATRRFEEQKYRRLHAACAIAAVGEMHRKKREEELRTREIRRQDKGHLLHYMLSSYL
ncbi:hypothetical protein Fcan01_26749 [Folsomia candida]|uniref:Uncharacterized protein n=1 Tax=Folsomia candida TaxID=158441 RepID=A0A226D2M3_FOLCA|nr:hypothetical protein Fcan01_26749 [Folsomia candida]